MSEVRKYRKKETVEAAQYAGAFPMEILEKGDTISYSAPSHLGNDAGVIIEFKCTQVFILLGSYVVKDRAGNYRCVGVAEFEATYEPVDEDAVSAAHLVAPTLTWRDLEGMKWDGTEFLASADGKHVGYTISKMGEQTSIMVTPHGAPGTLVNEELSASLGSAKQECEALESWFNSLNA